MLLLLLLAQDPIETFARELKGDDELTRRFRDEIRTPYGRIVLNDRAARAAAQLRRDAEKTALPDYFRARFEEKNGTLTMREGRDAMLEGYRHFRKDLETIRPILDDLAKNLVAEPAVNRKLAEFLKSPDGPVILYVLILRPRVRPGPEVIAKELGGVFVPGDDGRYYVADAQVEPVKEVLEKIRAAEEASTKIRDALAKFELAEPDELHQKLKQAFRDPFFVAVLLKDSLHEGSTVESIRGAGEAVDEGLAKSFEGGVLREEGVEEAKKLLETWERAKPRVDILRPAMRAFVARMRSGDPMHDELRKVLVTDLVLIAIAAEADEIEPDPAAALRGFLASLVVKNDDGSWKVIPEQERELAGGLRKATEEFGARSLREVDDFASKIADAELREAFSSHYGKLYAGEAAKELLLSRTFDGLAHWIATHFENGKIREGSRKEIEGVLEQAEKIRKESDK